MEENNFFFKTNILFVFISFLIRWSKGKKNIFFDSLESLFAIYSFFFSLSLSPDSQLKTLAFASLFFIKLLNFRLVYLSSFESKHLVFLVSLIHNLHWNLGFTDCINVDLDLCFVGSIKSKTLSEIMCLWRFMRLKKKISNYYCKELNLKGLVFQCSVLCFQAMATPARKRLMWDFKRLQKDPPLGISGAPQDNNIMHWNALIFGYIQTPFNHFFVCLHYAFQTIN